MILFRKYLVHEHRHSSIPEKLQIDKVTSSCTQILKSIDRDLKLNNLFLLELRTNLKDTFKI